MQLRVPTAKLLLITEGKFCQTWSISWKIQEKSSLPSACYLHPRVQPGGGGGGGWGVLEVYMTVGSNVFFWIENLHARYFFGSRDLQGIFLGLKKICVFFWVLSLSKHFVLGFRCL